jgi:hypothetical protein
MTKVGARLKICGTQKISTLIFNEPIYKEIPGRNKYGRNGKPKSDPIIPYTSIPDITEKELIIIQEAINQDIKEAKKENRKKTISRNITSIKDLVLSNINQWQEIEKFLTLSFRFIPTINQADYELKKFIQRLKYNYKKDIQYIAIRELQKENNRNAVHYHIFLFNCPYIKHSELLKLWCDNNPYMDKQKPSGVNIQAIKKGLNQVINYLTGYTLKDLTEEDDFLSGRKMVLKSQGLKKPIIKDYTQYENSPFSKNTIKKGVSYLDNKITYLEY